jgi:hypothetical protein
LSFCPCNAFSSHEQFIIATTSAIAICTWTDSRQVCLPAHTYWSADHLCRWL